MKNIYLIGMPGSGKTTVAKHVADKLGLSTADMDKMIVEQTGTSINDIFGSNGEDYFRDLETQTLKQLTLRENTVVATGGGVIKRKENVELLKSGTVIFIDVPVSVIAGRSNFSDRPLLKDNIDNLNNLYSQRYEIYKAAADAIVSGEGTPIEVAARILAFVKRK